ncbi:MAG: hypothetical protein JW738_00430, partial [Actinobacteria bacterium]|nr:hypothetical protein [Actinomycetota bacterium]
QPEQAPPPFQPEGVAQPPQQQPARPQGEYGGPVIPPEELPPWEIETAPGAGPREAEAPSGPAAQGEEPPPENIPVWEYDVPESTGPETGIPAGEGPGGESQNPSVPPEPPTDQGPPNGPLPSGWK